MPGDPGKPTARRLDGRIALVFGAGSILPGWSNGKAASVLYARHGAVVACVDIDLEAAQETARLIAEEGGKAEAHAADVTSASDIERVAGAVAARHGRIDILHNNVGGSEIGGPVEASEESWRRVIDRNLTSAFLACKAVLPGMAERRSGAIVNISSAAAIRYMGFDYISYYAAKGGLNQFTVGLALQYARSGIRVNAVMPGMMNTPLIYQRRISDFPSPEAMVAARDAQCPMGRMGDAWDVAQAALYLASDEAGYITGVCLPVDGGLTARCN
ncbi:SDR family NAD(P)-dependent oxidoreductase [Afifella sp. IM 167]|uniref:SDR family NAD(P)-dependent oxidoreductase n=1 Tax=Afifella sp. IM 167 TaxID=2033586 RepID=UPI001CCAD5F0|nr:SDR family oxidoreductase [Afifella sp. IM 167]MBZ8132392.1 3-oxoacyl-ACP reductase [Afifella sp. IM 167]